MEKISIGADIGGSHITTVAADLVNRKILSETLFRKEVDSSDTAENILSAWAESLRETISKVDKNFLAGIGFAMPGPFDYPGGIAQFNGVEKFNSLSGINIREEMIRRVEIPYHCPLRFVNDATCFAIGEAWMGKASAFSRVMAITLGTGFGSAFLLDGVPIETGDEVPGQGCLYYLPFKNSNADFYFSTRWFRQRYKEISGLTVEGVKDLSQRYSKEIEVKSIFDEFGNNLGQFLNHWLKLFKTECLVIGGNIAQSYKLFEHSFADTLRNNGINHLQVYLSELGENAAIIGSARLSDNDFYEKLDISAYK